jgi:4-amino-4-deoxy-L-arabinose transferase-like glycosyltransferase
MKHEDRTQLILLSSVAALAGLLEAIPMMASDYGLFIDEFYYHACAQRLDWGFVDHPPLAPLVLRVSEAIFGTEAFAFRAPPVLAMMATVVLTAILARRLGAGVWGQCIAAVAVMTGPVMQIFFGFFSMGPIASVEDVSRTAKG